MFTRQAVFLDRDGTVIEAIHRPYSIKQITAPFDESEIKFVPNAYVSLDKLKRNGLLRILITNQPDVANGYLNEETWKQIHKRVMDTLGFDDYFMCRHRTVDNCQFKKPSPSMLIAAADKWGIDLSKSWMVGDTDNDTKAGRAAGCKVILINRFYNATLKKGLDYDYRAQSLEDAVNIIISNSK